MKIFLFTRAWWSVAVIAGVALVAASPGAGRVTDPASHLWSVAQTPNPGYYGNIVWGVSARNEFDAWAVGVQATTSSNDTLAMHWNGLTWSAVPTPNPWPECQDGDILWSGNELSSVAAVSANDVWAVGSECYSAGAIIEHWNGSTWSLVASPRGKHGFDSTAALYGVTAVSPSNVWAVGYRDSGFGFTPLVEHYNGTAWTEVSTGGSSSGYLSGVTATGPNDVWAVGGTGDGNLIEHFDGTSWTTVATPQPGTGSRLDSVTAISPTDAWAVGSKTGFGARQSTFTLHWNGSTWSEVPSPNPRNTADATNELRSVAAVSSTNVWAVGKYDNEQTDVHQERTLTMEWDGSSWSIVTSPTPGETGQLTSIAAVRGPTTSKGDRIFAAGFFSQYERNIYDGHYTLPQTLVMR